MPPELTEHERQRLAKYVRSARLAAHLSIDDAALSAGMSPVTWGRVEKALPVRSLTYAAIERALGWRPGAIESALDERDDQDASTTGRATDTAAERVQALVDEIWADEKIPEARKAVLVQLVRDAEARRLAVEDELR